MIRLFNVYYPTRTLVLLLCEVVLVSGSFLLATTCITLLGPDGYVALKNALILENGLLKIAGITVLTLLLTYYFDLYGPRRISESWEIYFRLLLVLSVLSFVLAGLVYLSPDLDIGPYVLVLGVSILTVFLVLWRWAYERIIGLRIFRERVYILGCGHRARTVVETLRASHDAGMEVVGWEGEREAHGQLDHFAVQLRGFRNPKLGVDRVIVAMEDRRASMPLRELLDLRLRGVVIENASALLERLSGKLPLDGLNPSTLIFTELFQPDSSGTARLPVYRLQVPHHAEGRRGAGSGMGGQGRSARHSSWQVHEKHQARRDSAALECPARRNGLCRPPSRAPGVRAVAQPGDSLL
jgi:hypothetical protein